MATVLPWTQYTEAVVGLNHPTLADTDNRAFRQALQRSGFGADSLFDGFPLGNSVVNAGSSDFTGTADARVNAAIVRAVAASPAKKFVFVPNYAWDGLQLLPYSANLVTFSSAVMVLCEGGPLDVFNVVAYGADPANSNTSNAASFTAAIAAAAASTRSPKLVWVAARLIPYTAYVNLITFNTSVRVIREGGDPTEFDMTAYGANPNLTVDSTTGMQAAIDAQNAAGLGVVRISGQYYASTLFYYSNTILRGNGAAASGVGGSQIQQLNVALPILQPKTPASISKSFVFEDFAIYSGFAANTGGIDCTNCFGFAINNVIISTTNNYGFRVVGGPVAGNAGFGALTNVTIVNVTAGAYAFLIAASSVDQPDGMSFTDCFCSSALGTWIKYSGTAGHGATSQSWKGCRFESPGGSALADVTVDAFGAGPIWFTNCRFENTGTGGVQFTLQGIGGSPCAQFQNCSIAYGSGGLTWTDNGPVLSPRIGEYNTSLAIRNDFTTTITDRAVALVSGATPALDASLGNYFTLAILTNIAVTIAIPTNPPLPGFSRDLTIAIRNQSGGALTTPATFNAGANGFKFNGTVSPANGLQIEVKFRWDPVQSFWYEIARGGAL